MTMLQTCAAHNQRNEHLFDRCPCGFETNIRKCKDKPDAS
jgi:hypothetical protein